MTLTHKPTIAARTTGPLGALLLAAVLLVGLLTAPSAMAAFGVHGFEARMNAEDATPGNPFDNPPATQAGSHPYSAVVAFNTDFEEPSSFNWILSGQLKDLILEQPGGLSGDSTAMPQCSTTDFITSVPGTALPECPNETAVGVAALNLTAPAPFLFLNAPVYNLVPPPGVPVELGFNILNVRVSIDIGIKEGGEYNVIATQHDAPQTLAVFGGIAELWGNPSDPVHDSIRGHCVGSDFSAVSFGAINFTVGSTGKCTTSPRNPFLTLPDKCIGPVGTNYQVDSWDTPGQWVTGTVFNHDTAEPPNPVGFTGCGKLGFAPSFEAAPTTESAETGSGLNVNVDFNDEGLKNPNGLAESDTKKAEVTLPEGVTINPSIGEGLGVCTPADIKRETLHSEPGEGCPGTSKIGTLHVDTPIAREGIDGSVYLAEEDDPTTTEPGAENPFDSLIALYLVLRNPNLGVMVKLPMKVEPDSRTGQLVATLEGIPEVPFNHFNFHFREGARAALVSPSACGTYMTKAVFTPWANPDEPVTTTSSFEVTKGVNGGPCPPKGVPPFNPGFEAGSINNNAGSFSPFNMRLIREDGEQDMTKFSAVLPPGELGSLAGVDKCPDSAIAIARSKTGKQELASPSCPANSLIGHTLAGAGVGSALTYVKGYVYLGGAYHGDPLSVIAITPAVAGPFDAGTVVVQEALTLNPKTAEVEVDGANSDPIPHIIKGIVLKLRDLRLYVDRPNFTLNPTSCDESKARSVLFGSFLNVLSPSDDKPVDLSTRYQAANCLNLGFKPTLALNLKGGTKRGGHPGLRAIYTPRKGDANVQGLVVRLPRSAFLDQAHIKTICTRVQFAAKACPEKSQYGYIKAYTPLLDTPLEGPAYLRSSNHKLPDLVFDLHGLVDIEVVTRIDSQKGGIRATVEDAPDAPLSKVDLRMQGAKKGLIINSRNLCGHVSKANVTFTGHNGKEHSAHPVMQAQCGGARKGGR